MTTNNSIKCLDSSEELSLIQNAEKKLKGVIIDKDSNTVVQNFFMPIEFILGKDNHEINSFPTTLYKYVEGTSIRVYFWKDKWRISTTSRLDAFTSFWSNPVSFGALFVERLQKLGVSTLEEFYGLLDVSKVYFFLLPTSGMNRIGVLEDLNELFLIAMHQLQHEDTLQYGIDLEGFPNHGVWKYLDKYMVSDVNELDNLTKSIDTDGFIWFPPNGNNQMVKFVTESYISRCKLRDNQANISFRYLQLKKNGDTEGCRKLEEMYPEARFDDLDNTMERLSRFLHKMYINRYVHKEYVIVNRTYYTILKRIHGLYISSRVPTSIKQVKDVIMENDTRLILSLLRKFSNPT